MRSFLLSISIVFILAPLSTAQGPRLTAITYFAADENGQVQVQERWNTFATHPAWDVWVTDGPLDTHDDNQIINHIDGNAIDRTIDIELAPGENTFSFGVSHQIDGDACCEFYGLNLFINGSPTANYGEERPEISALAEPAFDIDPPTPDIDTIFPEYGTMGFPLATSPGAGTLEWEGGGFTVELTHWVSYPKSAGWWIDEMSLGSNLGPFVPDDEPDIVGQFTLMVTGEANECLIRDSVCWDADNDGDGVVGFGDFVNVSSLWGRKTGRGDGAAAGTAPVVPEPNTIALMMVGGLAVLFRRRK